MKTDTRYESSKDPVPVKEDATAFLGISMSNKTVDLEGFVLFVFLVFALLGLIY